MSAEDWIDGAIYCFRGKLRERQNGLSYSVIVIVTHKSYLIHGMKYKHAILCLSFRASWVNIYKELTWCNLAVCLLVTAILLYYSTCFGRFLRPSAGVLKNCSSNLWCMTWDGVKYPIRASKVDGFRTKSYCVLYTVYTHALTLLSLYSKVREKILTFSHGTHLFHETQFTYHWPSDRQCPKYWSNSLHCTIAKFL